MGIFKKLFKNEQSDTARTNIIFNPINGTIKPITSVADPVFAEKTMGDGAAIIPSEGKLYAPASGTIIALFPTGHALGIATDSGTELLIHIGIDTVELNGEGFESHIRTNQKVNKGDLLISFDLNTLKEKGYDPTVMVVVTNGDQTGSFNKAPEGAATISDKLFWFD